MPRRDKRLLARATAAPERRLSAFDSHFLEDFRYWVGKDRKTALRLFNLIEAVTRDPFGGIGKPEPLKNFGAGVWSRRLTEEHRLVYRVTNDRTDFLQGLYHY